MKEEIDVNKMAVEFVNQNLERIYDTGRDVLKGAAHSVRLRLSSSYRDYLSCVINRFSRAKSFFIRDEASYLYDFYVPLGISGGKTKIQKASIREISSINPFAVITGSAGSGKSMMMRAISF